MIVSVEGKVCSKCNEFKLFSHFTTNKRSKDGYRYQCRGCNQVYQEDPIKRKEWSARHYQKRKTENPALFMWKQAKHRAKWDYNEMEFTITVDDIMIPDECCYMGTKFIPLDPKYGFSLDRIDSSRGYVPDNIRVISRIANVMKNNATEQELISFAIGVMQTHQGRAEL